MAVFERRDPDAGLSGGESLFCIVDHAGGRVQLFRTEVEQLRRWLDVALEDQAPDVSWFQPGDEIEHSPYDQRQYARVLREETANSRRWLYVQALANESVQYRIHVGEVRAASRLMPDGSRATHAFQEGELRDVCSYCGEALPHPYRRGQPYWPLIHPEQIAFYVEQFGPLGHSRQYWLGDRIFYVVNEQVYPGVIAWVAAPRNEDGEVAQYGRPRFIVERTILEPTADVFFEAIDKDDIVCKR